MTAGPGPGSPTLCYTAYDPSPCSFPEPKVPLLPTFDGATLGGAGRSDFVVVGDRRVNRSYKRGRYALLDAYRLCGVGPEGALLAPAYHCRTMLDGAVRLGAELALYELDVHLAPRIDSLRALLLQTYKPVRAMLLTHYFGFAQDAAALCRFCDEHGIALIEDCSHALLNLRGHERLGQHGRYSIASPYKLLPCEEGGLLVLGENAAAPPAGTSRWAPLRVELSTLLSVLQRKAAHRRSCHALPGTEGIANDLARLAGTQVGTPVEGVAEESIPSCMYVSGEERTRGALAAGWLMRLCDLDHVAVRRRAHYQSWCRAVADLPHARPLFPQLPADCVPYMFPLLLDHPEVHFAPLKRLGMPIWRWDEMAVSSCETARHYRQHLLHLPCHQALTDAELRWMHEAVSHVLRTVPATNRPSAANAGGPTRDAARINPQVFTS